MVFVEENKLSGREAKVWWIAIGLCECDGRVAGGGAQSLVYRSRVEGSSDGGGGERYIKSNRVYAEAQPFQPPPW